MKFAWFSVDWHALAMHLLHKLILCMASFPHTGCFFHHTFHLIAIEPWWAPWTSFPRTKADSFAFVVLFFIERPWAGASHNNRAAKLSFYIPYYHPFHYQSLVTVVELPSKIVNGHFFCILVKEQLFSLKVLKFIQVEWVYFVVFRVTDQPWLGWQ